MTINVAHLLNVTLKLVARLKDAICPWITLLLFLLAIFFLVYSLIYFGVYIRYKKERGNPIYILWLKFVLCQKWAPIVIFVISSIVALIIWQFISYDSYYHGLGSSIKRYNNQYETQALKILANKNYSSQEKIDKLNFLASYSLSGITITNKDDGKQIIKTKCKYVGDAKPNSKHEEYTANTNKPSNIEFTFRYAVEPPGLRGIERSLFCSFFDILREQKVFKDDKWITLSFTEKCSEWKKGFFAKRYWRRSIHLFFPLTLIFSILCLAWGFWYKLKRTNEELEDFRRIHKKMYDDLSNRIVQIEKPLKKYEFSWDTYIKEVFGDYVLATEDIFDSSIEENKLCKDPKKLEEEFRKKYLTELKEKIFNIVAGLESAVTYEPQNTEIKTVIEAITKKDVAIPNYEHKLGYFTLNNKFDSKNNEYCRVNEHRLSYMVKELITNASCSCSRKLKNGMEKGLTYHGKILMDINRIKKSSKEFIAISITDNGEGFSKDIIDNIYKRSVKSSYEDRNPKIARGSLYVKFFADAMDITIKPENLKDDNIIQGAKVTLFVPIHTK